jgi:hypothetical protein
MLLCSGTICSSIITIKNNSENITIVYDSTESITTEGAKEVFSIVSKYHEDINLIEAKNFKDIKKILSKENLIIIYYFHGSKDAMYVNDEKISWELLGDKIKNSPTKHHIIESCNSQYLNKISNIYGINFGVDIDISIIHVLSKVSEIFNRNIYSKEKRLSDEINRELTNYVYKNIENITYKTLIPEKPLEKQVYDPEDPPEITNWGGKNLKTKNKSPWFHSGAVGQLFSGIFWALNKIGLIEVYKGENCTIEIGIDTEKAKRQNKIGEETSVGRSNLGITKKDKSFNYFIPYLDYNVDVEYYSFDENKKQTEEQLQSAYYWAPDRFIFNVSVFAEGGRINLKDIDGIGQLLRYLEEFLPNINFYLKPELRGSFSIDHYKWDEGKLENQLVKNEQLIGNLINFLGVGYSIGYLIELVVDIADILNFLVPGSGPAIKNILKIFDITAEVIFTLEFENGLDYNSYEKKSKEANILKCLVGIYLKGNLPTPGDLIERAINVKIPIPVPLELGFHFRGDTGYVSRTFKSSEGSFTQWSFPHFMLNLGFWAEVLWIFKFSWGNSWETDNWNPKNGDYESSDKGYGNGTFIDSDGDGVSNIYEDMGVYGVNDAGEAVLLFSSGLNSSKKDTDKDGLWDGNELTEFHTSPLFADTDYDNISDKDEINYWLIENNCDYMVDYDFDNLHCLIDWDSDGDGIKDGGQNKTKSCCLDCKCLANKADDFGERTIGTDPSLPDTDGDGLLDGEEVYWDLKNWYYPECLGLPADEACAYQGFYDENVKVYEKRCRPTDCYCFNTGSKTTYDSKEYYIYECYCKNKTKENDPGDCPWIPGSCDPCGVEDPTYIYWCITDPLKEDTDEDGLKDGYEKWYFNEGRIRVFNYNSTENDSAYEDYDNDCLSNIIDPDSDNDGLLDGEEVKYGTDPLNQDTDGDCDINKNRKVDRNEIPIYYWDCGPFICQSYGNFSDYWEIKGQYWENYSSWQKNRYCPYPDPTPTNPLKKDSNDNGISDFQEWEDGSCPISIDSDADGIPNDKESHEKYYNTICYDNDTDDDGLLDGFERDYFVKLGLNESDYSILSSYLNDYDVDDDLLLDGEEIKYNTDILDSDTDNDGILDGREIIKTTKFYNSIISTGFGTDPLVDDTDGDGLLDGEEVYTYKTDPLKIDTDGDSLTDFEESFTYEKNLFIVGKTIFKTDPLDPDTDDDTIPDGQEVKGWEWGINRIVYDDVFPTSSHKLWGRHIEQPVDDPDSEPWWKWSNRERVYDFPDPYRSKFETNPANPDTDGDGLDDGEEKDYVLSPMTDDTDFDGIPDLKEIEIMQNISHELGWDNKPKYGNDYWKQFDIWHYKDFDHDGLSDYNETFIADYYGADAQQTLDLLVFEDADLDNISDWEEFRRPIRIVELDNSTGVMKVTVSRENRYTNPLNIDTDNDKLNDSEELKIYGTDPLKNDSDSDGIEDGDEIYLYETDPLKFDTDSDGLNDEWTDGRELEEFQKIGIISIPLLKNYLNNPDSDDDGIVDSLEFLNSSLNPLYSNPLNADVDGDNTIDGYQTDLDEDGLSDYEEFKLPADGYQPVTFSYLDVLFEDSQSHNETYFSTPNYDNTILFVLNHTYYAHEDTDGDDINDGDEVFNYTDPLRRDTDEDFLLDGFEKSYYDYLRVQEFGFPEVTNGGPYQDFDKDNIENIIDFDSDNDGYSDGSEFENKTDPLNSKSLPGDIKKEKSPGFEILIILFAIILIIYFKRKKIN